MGLYADLERELVNLGVHRAALCINETPSDCEFCILDYGDGSVEVFFFERGQKSDLHTFSEATAAIAHYKQWVLSIPHLNNTSPLSNART